MICTYSFGTFVGPFMKLFFSYARYHISLFSAQYFFIGVLKAITVLYSQNKVSSQHCCNKCGLGFGSIRMVCSDHINDREVCLQATPCLAGSARCNNL